MASDEAVAVDGVKIIIRETTGRMEPTQPELNESIPLSFIIMETGTALKDLKVEWTMIGGRIVWERGETGRTAARE